MTLGSQETIEPVVYRFTIGDIECAAINDGTFFYTAEQYFSNVEPDALERAAAEHGFERDCIPSPYTCLLVNTGDHLVVVDTGGDRAALRHLPSLRVAPDVGHFQERFRRTGADPADVDRVIVTHAHPDHLGGNVDAGGEPFFPAARLTLWRDEWEYWTSPETLAAQPPLYAEPVRRHLVPFADRVELLEEECEIVPGIHVLHAPGHTPGHIALAVRSQGEELLYISDAALHPLHLENPDWRMAFDMDPAAALGSRRMLFDRAAVNGALVLAFHFHPFPSLGHVRKTRSGWAWLPLDTGA